MGWYIFVYPENTLTESQNLFHSRSTRNNIKSMLVTVDQLYIAEDRYKTDHNCSRRLLLATSTTWPFFA